MYNGGMTHFRFRITPYSFLVLVFACFMWFILMPSCKTYDCVNIPDTNPVLVDEYENTDTAWRGLLRSGDMDIRLKILHDIARNQSEEITKIHLATLLGLYDVALSPYPGAVSQTIRCDKVFKPVPKKITGSMGQEIVYFAGLLNTRMQYGSCVENQIAFRSYTGILYCGKQRKWAQIELIVPKDAAFTDIDGEQIMRHVSCKK